MQDHFSVAEGVVSDDKFLCSQPEYFTFELDNSNGLAKNSRREDGGVNIYIYFFFVK